MPRTKPPSSPSFFTVDSNFRIVKIKAGPRMHAIHNRAVMNLAKLIYDHLSKSVNYAHVQSTIPKSPIPISAQGKYYDISYLDEKDNLVLIEVKIVKSRS